VLLGFQRLVQAFRVPPPLHHAAGEFVDDDYLVVLDDVVAVALEQLVRAERLLHVVHHGHVFDVVERLALEQVGLSQQMLDALVARLGQGDDARLLVELEVVGVQFGDEDVDGGVEVGAIVERAGDDQRRARLVDQDRVHLVDDGEVVAALHHFARRVFHVVAQIIEAELVVGAVGDVAAILLAPLRVVELMHDAADAESQELIDGAHPGSVALGEIVVDRDDVDALAGERVEIHRKRGDQGLALAGLHFGYAALMQHHAADQLHVEMALPERALGGFAHGGERLGQEIVERGAGLDAGPKLLGTSVQRHVRKRGDFGLQRVDLRDQGPVLLQFSFGGRAEHFAGESAKGKHWFVSLLSARKVPRGPRQRSGRRAEMPGKRAPVRHKRGVWPCQRDLANRRDAPRGAEV
jgi:hypothetical protein